jgi:Arm DNA-binding domain
MIRGKPSEMGLGTHVSLELARQKATDARALLAEGIDPIEARDAQNQFHFSYVAILVGR